MDYSSINLGLILSLLFIVCSVTLAQNGEVELPCTHARLDCLTKVYNAETSKKIVFEVSCECKKQSADVSESLEYLREVKCPHIPNKPEDKLLDRSVLRIKNCKVVQKEFPSDLLKLLRRSKKFSVIVEDSTLRIPSFYEEDGSEPVIETEIKNSHVTGIGRGWFNVAKSLSLKIFGSSLGVLEAGVFGHYGNISSVDIRLENTNVSTFKSDAFSLPTNGRLVVNGGSIDQIEKHAVQGGKSVTFESSRIANVQNEAFNIYGMQKFNLDSNIFAEVGKMIIFQDSKRNRPDATKMPEVDQVHIKGNKFSKFNGDAFVGLCGERNLVFENNFINILTSPFRLESEQCPTLRKWKESVRSNGFRCQMDSTTCSYFADNMYMNCVLHGTSWCLCEDANNTVDNTHGKNVDPNEKDKGPCRVAWIESLKENCTNISEGSLEECAGIIDEDDGRQGRSLHISSSSNVYKLSYFVIFASVASMIYMF